MDCLEIQPLIHGYLDGELDLVKSLEIESHIGSCADCGQILDGLVQVRGAIRAKATYFTAPADLRAKIGTALRKEAKSEAGPGFSWNWLRMASAFASIVVLAIVVWVAGPFRTRQATGDLLAKEIVSDHIRSLLAEHKVDVVSNDTHTVKPWFDGKVDYSPRVVRLEAEGFPLIGGRLDYVADRTVSVLVYQRQKHFINLYEWPTTEKDQPVTFAAQQGFNFLHWNQAGMTYWAISDLNTEELHTFADLIATSGK